MNGSSAFWLRRLPAVLACLALAGPLAACSSDLASFDDTYVPASVEENFPITVVQKPVRLTLNATQAGLAPADANKVVQLAKRVGSRESTPVTVSYASGSRASRQAAEQAASIFVNNGLPRYAVVVSPRDGRENSIVLAFSTKVAETKPCGDWSQNLRSNQFNDSGPNFGCAVQQNMAAIIANPEDIEQAQTMPPALSASQSAALDAYLRRGSYYEQGWTEQVQAPVFSVGQQ